MLNTTLGRFRVVAILEGLSFIVLLFVAMPLKYIGGMPLMVKYVGWVHGLLFILYFLALVQVFSNHNWSLKKAAWCILASLLPFGPFVLDARLLSKEKE